MGDKTHWTRAYNWASGQVVSYTATDADSAALAEGEYCLSSTTDCWITMAAAPTAAAAAGSLFMSAGSLFHIIVTPAQAAASFKISAVRDASDGKLSIMPVL